MLDLFHEIWSTLRQNKLRTTLTGFAVSWGIFIIIVLLGTGNGLMNALLSNAGDEIMYVMRVFGGRTSIPYQGIMEGTRINLSTKDMEFSSQYSDHIDRVYGMLDFSETLSFGKETISSAVRGADHEYSSTASWLRLAAGRFINANDSKLVKKSIVIDSEAASQLLGNDRDFTKIVGRYVNVGDIPFRVVGVTEADEMSMGHESYISYNVAKGMRAENAYLSFYDMIFHGLETKKQNEDFEAAYKRSFNLLHGTAPDDKRTTYIDNMFLGNQELEKAMRIIRHC